MNVEQTTNSSQPIDGKTMAITSYIPIIGWIIAYIQYGNNKSRLAIFHIRQSMFLMLCALGACIISMAFGFIPYIGWIVSMSINLVMLGFLALWIVGLINAINSEQKPLPVLGNKAQDLLKRIK